MKGITEVTPSTLVSIFVMILLGVGIFIFLAENIQRSVEIRTGTQEAGSAILLHRLITDPDCLSYDGRSGVLNVSKLEEIKNKGEHPCAATPDFAHIVTVKDNKENTIWSFGYKGAKIEDKSFQKIWVTLIYPDGKTNPGQLSFFAAGRGNDGVLALASAAEAVWASSTMNGQVEGYFYIPHLETYTFENDKICAEIHLGNDKRCKQLVNARVTGDAERAPDSDTRCFYKMRKEGGVLRVSVDQLRCIR